MPSDTCSGAQTSSALNIPTMRAYDYKSFVTEDEILA